MKKLSGKKTWYLLAAGALLLAAAVFFLARPSFGGGTYENLIRNGDFEQISGSGLPAVWYTDAYLSGSSYTAYDVAEDENGRAGHIRNLNANDARFAQTVSVSPNTLYCLRGRVKADAQGGLGANLSIADVYVFSESVYETDGQWQEVALYGRTGSKQTSLTVFARLGGYSGEATGEAWFDDITLNRVDEVPLGFVAKAFYKSSSGTAKTAPATGAAALVLCSVAYLAFFLGAVLFLKKSRPEGKQAGGRAWLAFAAVLILGLAARLFIARSVAGYDVDIGCFRSWSMTLAEGGISDFYLNGGFCDYPPGYLWVLWAIGKIAGWLGQDVTEFAVKLPPLAADAALCVLLFTEGKKRAGAVPALCLTALYALNPLILVTGAAWGQADAVMLLLLFLALLFAMRGKWILALPLYMAAVLAKPQALMFGPLGLLALIEHLVRACRGGDGKARLAAARDALLGLLLAAAALLLIAGPFVWKQKEPLAWLINLYQNTMSQYGYVTVNACNLYFLLGKNWLGAETALSAYRSILDVLPVFAVWATFALPLCAAMLLRGRAWVKTAEGKRRMWLLGALAVSLAAALAIPAALGYLSYGQMGTVMIVFSTVLFALLYFWGEDRRHLPLLGAAMLLLLFNTGTMMHERYLFPAVGLLLWAYALKKDRRILLLAVGVSIFGFLNVGCCLDRNIRIGGAAGHLTAPAAGIDSDLKWLEMVSAAGNWLMGAYGAYLSAVLCAKNAAALPFRVKEAQTAPGQPKTARVSPLPAPYSVPAMTGRDWLVLGIVTVLYAVLALSNLGSAVSPQNAWVSRQEDECVVFDLGEEREFKMLFFNGIHWRSNWDSKEFTVQTSRDGQTWSANYEGSVKNGSDEEYTFDCFSWKYVGLPGVSNGPGEILRGRYVRLISQFPELTLYEVLFRDEETGEALPISAVSDCVLLRDAETGILLDDQSAAEPLRNPTLPCLTDEQDTLVGEPGSWYNSTYFDEIYHARTAYEHLHGLPVYETTHPPLGKVLMSFAIAVFGMTPFGWRFAGAFAGILMLPGMYLLGKMLIRKKWGGFAAMALMALDLMHFTQTRIATIDSFVVLFIIWSVYFMLRWFFLDDPALPLKKTLVPLALSGLFMGMAVASKWTGCYAGAGLAVMFFLGIWRRWRRCAALRAQEAEAMIRAAEKRVEQTLSESADKNGKAARGKAAAARQELAKAKESAGKALRAPWQDLRVKKLLLTVASCLIFFVAVPLLIYYLSYIPYFAPSGGVTPQRVIQAAEGMLSYHSQPGLGMNHWFYSPWYQWPVIAKPMWYYSGSNDPAGMGSTIMAMGNPAVWWTGLIGLFGVAAMLVIRHYDEKNHTLSLYTEKDDPRFALLLICFAAQYLPWVPVPRGTYIYHYFPSVPFIILCALLCLDKLGCRFRKTAVACTWALIAAAAILFVAFFPYASGVTVSTAWLEAMKWFPDWLWY